MSNIDGSFWQKQYEIIANILSAESDRFWTRFNASLLVNGGIIVAFSAIMSGFDKIESTMRNVSILALVIGGLANCVLWIAMIRAGRGAQDRLNALGKDIEDGHLKEIAVKYFGDDHNDKRKGFITKRAYWYAIIFIVFWSVLLIVSIYKMVN